MYGPAIILAVAIALGCSNIADALRTMHIDMKTTVHIADEADDGPR